MGEVVWPETRCSSCGAAPGAPCITSAGRVAHKPHKSRTAERVEPHRGLRPIPSGVRVQVGHRSGGTCEFVKDGLRCPRRATHLHHVRRRSQGGRDIPENLKHLCGAHHDYVHRFVEWSYEHGWLERTGTDG